MIEAPEPEFYRYCRSKGSAFGHSARKRNPLDAWLDIKAFLEIHTEYVVTLPIEIKLKITNGEFNSDLYEKITSLFGTHDEKNDSWFHWRKERDLDEVLNTFIIESCKQKAMLNELSISLYLNFYWSHLDENLKQSYSGAFERFFSHLNHGKFSIHIEKKVFIQPEFIVPYKNNENFDVFMGSLLNDLPFKFSHKAFISFYTKVLKSGKSTYKAIGYLGQ